MLDKRTHKVLLQLTKLCSKHSYEVIDLKEVLKVLPKKLITDTDGLKQDLQYLKDRQYIDIKHIDDEECCLSLLADARLYKENIDGERTRRAKMFSWTIISSICSFAFAFMGSFLAYYLLFN